MPLNPPSGLGPSQLAPLTNTFLPKYLHTALDKIFSQRNVHVYIYIYIRNNVLHYTDYWFALYCIKSEIARR